MALSVAVILGDPRLPYPYALDGRFGAQEQRAVDDLREALDTLSEFRFSYFDEHARLLDDLRAAAPDLALNLCDTGYRNRWEHERNVPSLLEILEVPYTGSDAAAIVLSNDKALVSAAAQLAGVAVPKQSLLDLRAEWSVEDLAFPCLLKPNVSCGSYGITDNSVVRDVQAAQSYVRWLREELAVEEVVCQEFLPGAEYTVGVLGNPDASFEVLPALEVDFSGLAAGLPAILTHGSKADENSAHWQQIAFKRAELSPALLELLGEASLRLCRRLGFRDYARIDFRCGEDGLPRLIDANVNPTWYRDAKLSLMASWAGHTYPQMLRTILHAALRRHGMAMDA